MRINLPGPMTSATTERAMPSGPAPGQPTAATAAVRGQLLRFAVVLPAVAMAASLSGLAWFCRDLLAGAVRLPAEARRVCGFRADVAKQRIGVVSQFDSLDPDFSCAENLLVFGRYFGIAAGS